MAAAIKVAAIFVLLTCKSRRETCFQFLPIYALSDEVSERENAPIDLKANRTSSRIVGGTDASKEQFSFMVSLQLKNFHFCGGSLLNEKWVLSSAYCTCIMVKPQLLPYLEVFYNSMNIDEMDKVGVSKTFCHDRFVAVLPYRHDVGLIELKEPIPENSFKPVVLADSHFSYDTNQDIPAVTAGWGTIDDYLQVVELSIYTYAVCSRCCGKELEFAYHVCAGKAWEVGGACKYDYGGPLLISSNMVQVGVFSYNMHERCGVSTKNAPNLFIRVSTYVGWIRKYTRDLQTTNGCRKNGPLTGFAVAFGLISCSFLQH